MIAVPVMMAFQDAEAAKSHVWRTCVIFEVEGCRCHPSFAAEPHENQNTVYQLY
jgi:hypothetical protein